jgi:hypothetical protein
MNTRAHTEQENMAELSYEELWHGCQRKPGDFEPYGKRTRLAASDWAAWPKVPK